MIGGEERSPEERHMAAPTETTTHTSPPESVEPGPLRVLLGVDGSDCASAALDFVDGLPWPAESDIRVVEAVEDQVPAIAGPWPTYGLVEAPQIADAVRQEADRTVAALVTKLQRPGISVTSDVIAGHASNVITDSAQAFDADLIVVGSHGRGAIKSMVLGSVSADVVAHAHEPVVVARQPGVARVLLAWDGSVAAQQAANLLLEWPIFDDSIVRVASVAQAGPDWMVGVRWSAPTPGAPITNVGEEPSLSHHTELAEEMVDRLSRRGLDARADVREGDPAKEILSVARTWQADLIVMGTHGRTGLQRLVLGSVAQHVISHSPCSVLVAREPEAETADGT
jgi:nucleotide-binding universal stress UspA family protein